jgi:hypothetical protein
MFKVTFSKICKLQMETTIGQPLNWYHCQFPATWKEKNDKLITFDS